MSNPTGECPTASKGLRSLTAKVKDCDLAKCGSRLLITVMACNILPCSVGFRDLFLLMQLEVAWGLAGLSRWGWSARYGWTHLSLVCPVGQPLTRTFPLGDAQVASIHTHPGVCFPGLCLMQHLPVQSATVPSPESGNMACLC